MPLKSISIVAPMYNEESLATTFLDRLTAVTRKLGYRCEIIIVDDGSSDHTLDILLDYQKKEPSLKIVKLSRNWGHQNAFTAGLDQAKGDAVILMDADLEDPPELIPAFIEEWERGCMVVHGVKKSRQDSLLRKMLFSLFYRLTNYFSFYVKIIPQSGIFSLLDSRIAGELRRCKEVRKFYTGLRFYVGFRQATVTYDREKRLTGEPKQNFRRLLNLALDAIFANSFMPIRLLSYLGIILLAVIFLASCALCYARIFMYDRLSPYFPFGWSSLVLVMFFVLGVQLLFLGIIGEYVARIFEEVRSRPQYIVDEILTVPGKTDAGKTDGNR